MRTKWKLNNTEMTNLTSDAYCQPLPDYKLYMFPELRSKDNAVEHCGSLGGLTTPPKNIQINRWTCGGAQE